MARHQTVAGWLELNALLSADLLCLRASGMEGTAGGNGARVGSATVDPDGFILDVTGLSRRV